MEQDAAQTAGKIWGTVTHQLPWTRQLGERLRERDVRINHVERHDEHLAWFVHIGLPQVLQNRYGLAPELLLLVAHRIHANDLVAMRDRISTSDRPDPDIMLIADGQPDLSGRLRRLSPKSAHQLFPIVGDADFETQLATLLPTRDLFDRRDPVRGRYQVWGREQEHIALKRAVLDGQAVAVVGLRKIGKSTLVHGVLDEIREAGWAVDHVDL